MRIICFLIFLLFGLTGFYSQELPDLIPFRSGKKWGYCDREKKIVIEPKYDEVRLFAGDKAAVRSGIYWGYINKSGNVVIPIVFYAATDFYGDNFEQAKITELVKVTPKGGGTKRDNYKECGTLDASLKNMDLTFEYRDMLVKSSPCVMEYVYIINGDGKKMERLDYEINFADGKKPYSTILKGKKEIGQKPYQPLTLPTNKGFEVFLPAGENMVSVKQNGKWGYADTSGKIIVELKYSYTGNFSEGIAITQSGEKFVAIDKNGNELFTYDKGILVGEFHDGLILAKDINKNEAAFYKRDKYGFLNTSGEYVIRPQFKNATPFYEGYAVVKDSLNRFHYIDLNGRKVPTEPNWEIPVECCTEYLGPIENLVMAGGLFKVKRKFSKKSEEVRETQDFQYSERLGFIDKNGKEVSPCEYDSTGRFVMNVCKVTKDRKEGLIGATGKKITELKYDELNMPKPFGCNYPSYKYKTLLDYYAPYDLLKKGLIRVILNDKIGLIDLQGNEYFED